MSAAAAKSYAWFNSRTERPGHEVMVDVFRFTADKIEADPSLLEIPLANIDRWLLVSQSSAKRLEQWRSIILEAQASVTGMQKLLALLRDQSAEAIFLKEFAPFPGVLTKAERAQFQWTSAH
ncbi:hypothetical protein [Prosthecobacter sp.]|uniref:hypothetical protein n=1 Tax=Prosthecobacter sp. TaxID=1965333 RepID=UPI00248744C7|nr:hypothetical protein [Prosthecobacter sp.]MDI1314360.1 hypothetical protein [Prosthecobacter sp.]